MNQHAALVAQGHADPGTAPKIIHVGSTESLNDAFAFISTTADDDNDSAGGEGEGDHDWDGEVQYKVIRMLVPLCFQSLDGSSLA
jgi:hypothetical protein